MPVMMQNRSSGEIPDASKYTNKKLNLSEHSVVIIGTYRNKL
jgi:hypothetical protein